MSSPRPAHITFCALILAVLAMGGCYERVVAGKGFGRDRVTLSQPNVSGDSPKINGYRKLEHERLPE